MEVKVNVPMKNRVFRIFCVRSRLNSPILLSPICIYCCIIVKPIYS